jgi:diguanylate cyclase (GGDEF)-like protein
VGEEVPILLAIARELRKVPELRDALRALTEGSLELVAASQSTARVLDAEGRRLLVGARTGPSVHSHDLEPFCKGEGVVGWVVEHGEPALVTDCGSDERFAVRDNQVAMPTSLVAAPMPGSSGPLGVLSMARMESPAFGSHELDLVCLLAEMAAPHLDLARLAVLSQTDELTLLYNRRYLDGVLPREMDRSRRYGHALSVLMIDLDHFKRVNDDHGHDVGDEVLGAFGDRLRALSRYADVAARWGGEEFLVMLPETAAGRAREVAERLRRGIGGQPYHTRAGAITVTLSVGVATLRPGDDRSSLVRRADDALYAAKRGGRDRVEGP